LQSEISITLMTTQLLFIGTTELLIIGAIALLLFGGKKLPELMKGLGQGVSSFKKGMNEGTTDDGQRTKGDGQRSKDEGQGTTEGE